MNSASSRYRSYSDKKSQSKKLKTYMLRILILIVGYTLFTSFIALTVGVRGDSMSPSLNDGNSLIILPSHKLTSMAKGEAGAIYRRGEVVLSGTNYEIEAGVWEKILDPIVRILTLQKRSLKYNNRHYNGRAEILRVVGLPGDSIKIKDYTVFVRPKGEEFFLSEFELAEVSYDIEKSELPPMWKEDYPFSTKFDEVVIKEGTYFLISDNRAVLNDSRVFGAVNSSSIKGRALVRYWPFNEFKLF